MRSAPYSWHPSRMDQELDVALGPVDRALRQALHAPARLRLEPSGDALAHLAMERGIAYHAAFADLALADFELRLDQRNQARRGRGERQRGRQHDGEADEARVADDEVGRFRDLPPRQIARVAALEHGDA